MRPRPVAQPGPPRYQNGGGSSSSWSHCTQVAVHARELSQNGSSGSVHSSPASSLRRQMEYADSRFPGISLFIVTGSDPGGRHAW